MKHRRVLIVLALVLLAALVLWFLQKSKQQKPKQSSEQVASLSPQEAFQESQAPEEYGNTSEEASEGILSKSNRQKIYPL